jgi:ankyrin repeat protein
VTWAQISNVKHRKLPSPLAIVSKFGLDAVVRRQLKSGADIDIREDDGPTVLSLAAINGHVPVVVCLLQAGANQKTRTADISTAPIDAVKGWDTDVVKRLLEAGAKPEELNLQLQLTP